MIEDRLPIERRILDGVVARVDVLAHFGSERLAVAEPVADADATARHLVFVRRADAARRRADLALATARLGQHVELAVVRQDDVRLLADEQPAVDANAGAPELVDLGKERLRIDHDAVANHAGDAGMQDARRDQAQDELRAVDIDRVPGVVPPLLSRDDREVRRQQIDNFALALITPLRAENGQIHKSLQSPVISRRS